MKISSYLWRIGLVLITLVCIAVCVMSVVCMFGRGTNYTEDYKVYSNVKDLTTADDIRNKLQELKIEYVLYEDTIELKAYEKISFQQGANAWYIVNNKIFDAFEILDTEDHPEVAIYGNSYGDKVVEEFSYASNGGVATKIGSNYYYLPIIGLIVLFFVSAIMGGVLLCIAVSLAKEDIKMAKAKKQVQAE